MAMNHRLLRPRASGPGSFLLNGPGANARAAWSLRRLSSSYTGPAIQVRRSNDNAEETFTPEQIASGYLVEWVGGGNSGFVKTWYDQSGNGLHVSQSTSTDQPRIVNAGSIETDGGRPCINFLGGGDKLTVADDSPYQEISAYVLYSFTSGYAIIRRMASSVQPGDFLLRDTSFSIRSETSTDTDALSLPGSSGQRLVSMFWDGQSAGISTAIPAGSAAVFSDGALQSDTATDDNFSETGQGFGFAVDVSFLPTTACKVSEAIFYNKDTRNIRQQIEANINSYYGAF